MDWMLLKVVKMLRKRLGIEAIEADYELGEDLNFIENTYNLPSSLIIPEGCKRIGRNAFIQCVKLDEVIIPGSVVEIGNGSFWNCRYLKTIKILKGVKKIGDNAFWTCSKLKEVIMSEGIEEIGISAFSWCDNLKEVNIPKSIKVIGNYAFWGCKLSNVEVPSDATIGYEAFVANSFSTIKRK